MNVRPASAELSRSARDASVPDGIRSVPGYRADGSAAVTAVRPVLAPAAQPTSGALAEDRGPARMAFRTEAGLLAQGDGSTTPVQLRRGGGPATASRLHGAQVLRVEDQVETTALSLPSGCTRLSVAATPAVRDVSIRVTEPSGRVQSFNDERGRSEVANVCTSQPGEHTVEVRLRPSGDGSVGAQLFVRREGADVAEALRRR